MPAGDNERRFRLLFNERVVGANLCGKRKFIGENVEISVDDSFSSNGIEYLIEIDSGNMAKLLVGQYTLLDALYTGRAQACRFLIVHTYKGYNISRTIENLRYIKSKLGLKLQFLAVHMDSIEGWAGGDVEAFIGLAATGHIAGADA